MRVYELFLKMPGFRSLRNLRDLQTFLDEHHMQLHKREWLSKWRQQKGTVYMDEIKEEHQGAEKCTLVGRNIDVDARSHEPRKTTVNHVCHYIKHANSNGHIA